MNIKNKNKVTLQIIVFTSFALLIYFSFLPGTSLPIFYGKLIEKYPNFDLLIHILVFFFIYLITYLNFNKHSKEKIFVFIVVLSSLLELAQPMFSPQRLFTVSDLLSNYLGIALAYLTILLKSKRHETYKT